MKDEPLLAQRAGELIYLASPYTHPDQTIREFRYRSACRCAGQMLAEGKVIYSPIVHGHAIGRHWRLPTDWEFWRRPDRAILERCDYLYVLMLDGWRESVGVAAEIGWAEELGKPIVYVAERFGVALRELA